MLGVCENRTVIKGDNKGLLVLVLIAAVLMAVCLALVHNHYSELGRRFDPSCPICQMLMGFVLLLVTISVGIPCSEIVALLFLPSSNKAEPFTLSGVSPRAPPIA